MSTETPIPEPVTGSALLPYGVDEGAVAAAGYRIRVPTPRRLGAFLKLLSRSVLDDTAEEVDSEGLLQLFLNGGLAGEVLALTVERLDGEPLDAEEAENQVPSYITRAALVTYYVELAQVHAVLNGPTILAAEAEA